MECHNQLVPNANTEPLLIARFWRRNHFDQEDYWVCTPTFLRLIDRFWFLTWLPATTDLLIRIFRMPEVKLNFRFGLPWTSVISLKFLMRVFSTCNYAGSNSNAYSGRLLMALDFSFRTIFGTPVSNGVEAFVEFWPITAFVGNSSICYYPSFRLSCVYSCSVPRFWAKLALVMGNRRSVPLQEISGEWHLERSIDYGQPTDSKDFSMIGSSVMIAEPFLYASNSVRAKMQCNLRFDSRLCWYQIFRQATTYKKKYSLKSGVNNLAGCSLTSPEELEGIPDRESLPAEDDFFTCPFGVEV